MSMPLQTLLDALFPHGHAIAVNDSVLTGSATTEDGEVTVIGTADKLEVGVDHALALAETVLASTAALPQRPIVMLVDTAGQRLARRDELLGINGYFAHLAQTLDLARRRGARLVTLVYGESVSGGFLSFGLMADHIHALPDAQVRVMDLRAMARVTKQPLEKLQALSQNLAGVRAGRGELRGDGCGGIAVGGRSCPAPAAGAAHARRRRPACRTRRTSRRPCPGGRGFICGGPRRCLSGPPATRWPGCRPMPTGGLT